MGIAHAPEPVKLFAAIMYQPSLDISILKKLLIDKYGLIEASFGPIPFTFTDYYAPEMGESLVKEYHVFNQPVCRDALPEIKAFTNEIEQNHSRMGKRGVNIDPGYISRDKLVLASTKDFYHRLYLGQGIFGEATLHYRKGAYRYFSWTYPDYKLPEVQSLLEKGRASLVGSIRKDQL
jgi:hypothetical protein